MHDLDQDLREALRNSADGFDPHSSLSLPDVHRRAHEVRARTLVWVLVFAVVAASGAVVGIRVSRSNESGTFTDKSPKHGKDPHFTIARAETWYLLNLFNPPGGAVEARNAPSPHLSEVPLRPGLANFIYTTRWWTVPTDFDSLQSYLSTHVPPGLRRGNLSGSGSGPDFRDATFTFEDTHTNSAYENAELLIEIVSISPHVTGLRADGTAVWITSTPQRVQISGPRTRVTASSGCPHTIGNAIGISNPASTDLLRRLVPSASPTAALRCAYRGVTTEPNSGPGRSVLVDQTTLRANEAKQLAQTIASLPLGSPGLLPHGCEMLTYENMITEIIVFSYQAHPDIDLWHWKYCGGGMNNGFIMTSSFIPSF